MTAKELQKVVQSIVSTSIKEQQTADWAKFFIAVYGFLEDGDNHKELLRMFGCLQCRCVIISHARIGNVANRDTKSAKWPHSIKVEFKLLYDVSSILNNTKFLKEDKYYAGVNLCKWLSREELINLKRFRPQCIDLNKAHSADAHGHKPFIVISGKLMKRDEYGKLQAFSNAPVSSQSKNAKVGSHVAP